MEKSNPRGEEGGRRDRKREREAGREGGREGGRRRGREERGEGRRRGGRKGGEGKERKKVLGVGWGRDKRAEDEKLSFACFTVVWGLFVTCVCARQRVFVRLRVCQSVLPTDGDPHQIAAVQIALYPSTFFFFFQLVNGNLVEIAVLRNLLNVRFVR